MEPGIIFEDKDILVLDKPSGMTVNRADTTKGERTLQDWVEEYLKILNSKSQILNKSKIRNSNNQNSFESRPSTDGSNFEFSNRAGIVHRLDKETSGILLVAKSPEAFENLQKQFKERKVKKTYIALVHGKVEPQIGEINVPVGRLPWNRMRFGVISGGREALTRYKLLSVFSCQLSDTGQPVNRYISLENRPTDKPKDRSQKTENRKQITEHLSLLELYPKTGRTHQIRVHLKYFNHPIFSDPLYAGRKTARNDRKLLPRIFLHASEIFFLHPRTQKIVSFESPLPKKLNDFLEILDF